LIGAGISKESKMFAKKWMLSLSCALMILGLSGTAFAQDFQAFTPVQSVCPDCALPKADVLTLSGGQTLRGTVVAENQDFYVVVRYGEVRAIPKTNVQSIAWADGTKPGALNNLDQIVLQNGHVLSGTIIQESNEPPYIQIKSSFADFTYTVAKSEVAKAYKGGSVYQVKMPVVEE
jgi:hypothetical protein